MKKALSFFSLLLMTVALSIGVSGCKEDSDPDEVTVSMSQVSFTKDGGTQTVMVMSNTNWTVTGMQYGITVSPMQGSGNGTISITAPANTDTYPHNVALVITAGSASAVINITQVAGTGGTGGDGQGGELATRVSGTYVGKLYYGEEVIEDAYPITVSKLNATAVSVTADFFGGSQNFNLTESMDQIVFSNSLMSSNITMYVTGSTMVVNYLSQGGYMIKFMGQK